MIGLVYILGALNVFLTDVHMYRIILFNFPLLLWLWAGSCDGITYKHGNSEQSTECVVELGGVCIEAEDGAVLTVAVGLLGAIDDKLFRKAVDKVLQTYQQNPKAIAALGLVVSIAFLKDSLDDHSRVALYDSRIKSALRDKDKNSRLERLQDIKVSLKSDLQRQKTMGFLKGLFAIGTIIVAYQTIATWLFWPMAGAATISSTATLVNAYNYNQFSTLMTKLKQDGHHEL